MAPEKPPILVYRDLILPPSETFIKNQVGMLKCYTPYIVGSRREPGIELHGYKILLLNQGTFFGRIQEALYKLFGFAPYLAKRIKRLHPLLAHVHMGKDATLFLPLHKKLNIPLLVTFHGTDGYTSDKWKKDQGNITQKIYLRRRSQLMLTADAFIATSHFVKHGLLRQGFPEDKIIVHYIGIDLSFFKPDPAVKRESVVLFVSRLEKSKGCQYIIRAMKSIQEKRNGIKLVVIGDGPYRQRLENQAKESLRHYEFLGIQSPDVVKEWMNKAWVLSVPTLMEGLPTFVQESMAMGLPMALFSIPAIEEAIGLKLRDCVVPARDVKLLANLILRLFENNEMWQKMSRLERERALSHFNLERQTGKLENIYKHLIDEHRQWTEYM